MEILSDKISILAGLFGIVGLIGLALFLLSIVFLIIRIARFDSIIPALVCILVSIGVIVGGLFLSPMPDFDAVLEKAAADRAAKAQAKEDQAEDGEDGEEEPEAPGDENQPEENEEDQAAPTAAEGGVLCEGTLNGWSLRMTLPKEWQDEGLVIERTETSLSFSQKASLNVGGTLFSLTVIEDPFDPEAEDAPPAFDVVVVKEGVTLLALYPTDVQFNEEDMEAYQRMEKDIPGILESVEFERT